MTLGESSTHLYRDSPLACESMSHPPLKLSCLSGFSLHSMQLVATIFFIVNAICLRPTESTIQKQRREASLNLFFVAIIPKNTISVIITITVAEKQRVRVVVRSRRFLPPTLPLLCSYVMSPVARLSPPQSVAICRPGYLVPSLVKPGFKLLLFCYTPASVHHNPQTRLVQ